MAVEWRRKVLRYMLADSRGSSKMYGFEDLARALGIEAGTVRIDLHVLAIDDLVHVATFAGHNLPDRAALNPKGIRVAQEGWPRHADMKSVEQSNTYNVRGDGTTIATSVSGSIHQNVSHGATAELRQVLGQLAEAIEQATHFAEEHREDGADAVARIHEELDREEPRPERMRSAWRTIGRIADVGGAAQVGVGLYQIYQQATPLIAPYLQLGGG